MMIRVEQVDDVAVVHVEHGKVNALDVELLHDLATTVDEAAGTAGAIVLTGNGRVFSAGADLSRVLEGGAGYAAELIPALHRAFVTLFSCPRPVVAGIDGAAIAGGCVIAAACDHRVMAQGPARIGAIELVVGVPFPVAALEILRHACGARTGDLVLRARLLDVDEAVAVGLVHTTVPPERVLEQAVTVAAELAALPGEAYALAKRHLQVDSIERIERDAARLDAEVTERWASPETAARIAAQLERVRAARA